VVTRVPSTPKLDLARSWGGDNVLDYTRDDVAAGPELYDLILDIGGDPFLTRVRRALTPRGTALVVGRRKAGT
jgi:NADPH:quinone reductase-like Zn-dependent oxidoreductase